MLVARGCGVRAGAHVCRLFQERADVFQRFATSASGVLLCTVSAAAAAAPGPSSFPNSCWRVFQDVAARGLDLPQVTWILQVSPRVHPQGPAAL